MILGPKNHFEQKRSEQKMFFPPMQTVTREGNISKLFTETRNELGLSEKGERREREKKEGRY